MTALPRKTDHHLRVASYNIRKSVGLDQRRDPHRVARVLAALSADVVALQEADRRLPPRRAALPADLTRAEAGLQRAPVALNAVSLGWHGNALLLADGWDSTHIHRLSLPGLEPRGAVIADLAGPFGPLRVVATHLGLRRRDRQRQMTLIMAELAGLPARPTVLLGDLNEWAPAAGFAPLDPYFTVHRPGRSFPAFRPVAALDRVATGPDLRLERAGVMRAGAAGRASDHLPVWADISRVG
ncbi:endonuclease/exonuclease/phosphatase family protein [Rhodophyticola porphyridii]|uniref:Metal-dependent hydrolase n=1 Tax=Rhodophyticola porphyridii TaxID=1852017 RepID=A0A3L9Y4P4_9RHOB|nr:endonuclease/exonuclease/phosphatase family protein [Rhodophyticola porphyridii]RMA42027.1 metal-dependent hydrolase [Rhodophyticola porphyridii]